MAKKKIVLKKKSSNAGFYIWSNTEIGLEKYNTFKQLKEDKTIFNYIVLVVSYDETNLISMGVLKKIDNADLFWKKHSDRKFCTLKSEEFSNELVEEADCDEISPSEIKNYYHGEDVVHTRPRFFKRKVRNLPDLDMLKSKKRLREL